LGSDEKVLELFLVTLRGCAKQDRGGSFGGGMQPGAARASKNTPQAQEAFPFDECINMKRANMQTWAIITSGPGEFLEDGWKLGIAPERATGQAMSKLDV
jgi:hypothetical protein